MYFHCDSVVGEFADLEQGSRVRLEVAERDSEQGWRATTVRADRWLITPSDTITR